MILHLRDRFARGAFADVFRNPERPVVYKLFRRLADPRLAHVAPYVFSAETQAYEICDRSPALQQYVPAYHGAVPVASVLSDDGGELRRDYWLDLCYCVERLEPDQEERKFGSFYNDDEWHLMEPIDRLFTDAGIGHLGDASVLHWRSGRPKLIDFAVSDAAADYARVPS
ncbi:MAG: hypothetical protein AB7G10_24760 [Reyranellaceae bacterium]